MDEAMVEAQAEQPPVVFLMGPTGSGKSALAIALSEYLPFDIVSVDSAMVYRGMDIGTAKPPLAVRAVVPHRLIDIRDPIEPYSAAEFRVDAGNEIEAIIKRGRIPLLVGGTGLYFRVLAQGISALPAASPAIRARLAGQDLATLHARLSQIDPRSARRIHPNDPQRIWRALEVFEATGRTLSEHFEDSGQSSLPHRILKLVVAPSDRRWLHARIAARFEDMLAAGFSDEVVALRAKWDLHPGLPARRLVGYREMWRYVAGDLGFDAMRESAVTNTRRLARRQLTWLRREPDAHWIDCQNSELLALCLNYCAQDPMISTLDCAMV